MQAPETIVPHTLEDLPCIKLDKKKGLDNLFYNIKIYNDKENNTIFIQSEIENFDEIMYSKKYKGNELFKIECFKIFHASNEIFNKFFKDFKDKKLNIFKNDNKINLSWKFKLFEKPQKVEFILEGNFNEKKLLFKLSDKIVKLDKELN